MKLSIIVVTHNNENDILDCLNSINNQNWQDFEIIIIDNNSEDKTVNIVKENFENDNRIKIKALENNLYYAGGNNMGFKEAQGDWVLVLNPDTIVDRLWLEKLINCTNEHPNFGIYCSNILLDNEKNTINACGNELHLSGLVFSRFYQEKECKCVKEEILLPSGASFMFKKEIVDTDSPFNDKIFPMEFSDVDFALRLLEMDKRCCVVPESKVYHKYKFKMSKDRFRYLEKSRYLILRHLTSNTRKKLLPSLIRAELLIMGFAIRNGFFFDKLKITFSNIFFSQSYNPKTFLKKDYMIVSRMNPDLVVYHDFKTSDSERRWLEKFNHSFRNNHTKIMRCLEKEIRP